MPDKHERKSGRKKQPNAILKYSALATQMMVIIIVGALGGIQLDKIFETQTPWFTGGLTILSVFVAMYFAMKDLLKG